MATVNKDFKIKSGLIVEGTTGTINGEDILTTSQASTDYIVNIVGGTTLVTSVQAEQLQVVDGELSVKPNVFDGYGAADDALNSANNYTDGEISSAVQQAENYADSLASNYDPVGSAQGAYDNATSYADTAASAAENNAKSYADGLAVNYDAAGSADAAEAAANSYTDDAVSQEVLDRNSAISSAISTEVTDRNDAIDTAITNLNLSGTYDALGAAASALSDANDYTDTAVANLVDGAPALLDTLNELAAAIADNPNYATDVANLVATKADTTYVDSEVSDAISTAATDATTKADAAEANANTYTDGKIATEVSDRDSAISSAINTEVTNRNSAIDSAISQEVVDRDSAITTAVNALTTSDIEEGTNLYFTNQRAIDAVGGTIGDAINLLTTDDIEEGDNNLYFTNTRVENAIIEPLTLGTQTNISVTYNTGTGAYDFVAENGVADSNTDDLAEGETNLYFTQQRVIDAIDNQDITPKSVQIDTFRKEEATQTYFNTASTATVHSFAYPYGSVKYVVRTVGTVSGTLHSQVTEILATVDGNNNVAVTEFGSIHTTEPALASFIVDYDGSGNFRLRATVANAGSEVIVAATLLSWAD
jgi:hypothetical protein